MSYYKINLKLLSILFATLMLAATACNKDDDDDHAGENEEELITTVRLIFTNTQTNAVSSFEGKDLDGVGGNPPLIDPVALDAQSSYDVRVEFLDESNAQSVEDITEEVEEEDEEHLVCYDFTGNINQVQTTDTDGDGNPLGLEATLSTGDAGAGTLTVTLKHEPDKNAADPCATGETDVELQFNVTIQ